MSTTGNKKDTFVIQLTSSAKKPFNENDLKKHFAHIKSPAEVTSIPSPYAPMHLANMAFFAANAHGQENRVNLYKEGTGELLYDKLISHILDIFELLFYWDELNLDQKGFSIEAFAIPSLAMLKEKTKSSGEDKEKHLNFRTTLDLYIDRYKSKRNLKGVTENETKDAIDCGYYIKYKDEIIAVTSPLTGFFISASANFGQDGIGGVWQNNEGIVYLSNDEAKLRPLAKRSLELRIFLCKFINEEDYCPRSYTYFKDYIKDYAKDFEKTDEYKNSKLDLAKFGFDATRSHLELIRGAKIIPDTDAGKAKQNTDGVIVIPNRYNKIYFRSLIDVKKGVHFNLKAEDYKENLDNRILLGQNTKWLSVDDFFQNDIIELDDAMNTDRFYTCKVFDQNDIESEVKLLLPLKEAFFKYFNYDSSNKLEDRLIVRKVSNKKYVATLTVPTESGEVILKKDYLLSSADKKAESSIMRLSDDYDSLYLGIYPFVKDTKNRENNGFFRVFTYHSTRLSSILTFYKDTPSGLSEIKNKEGERNLTVKSYQLENSKFPISTYYALESSYIDIVRSSISEKKDVDFELIGVAIKKGGITCNAYITPRFIEKNGDQENGMLSVDFGTSNTNISIGYRGTDSRVTDFDSKVRDENANAISQIVMLHKPMYGKFDLEGTVGGRENQIHFLSEFMPADISPQSVYKFAIPSILNSHESLLNEKSVSLVHSNISIGYYKNGLRKLGRTIDKAIPNFKWVEGKELEKTYAYLFIDQLLLMSRSWFLSNGVNLDSVEVIFSLPLSMDENDEVFYRKIWGLLYQKYFSRKNVERNLSTISESASPYYAYLKNDTRTISESLVLLDVGGGSTDVLFYYDSQIKGTVSYPYAGDALFEGNKNENIFIKEMPIEKSDKSDSENVEENVSFNVGSIFNYRFTKKENEVNTKFRENEKWKFLLLLHTSAIIYHVVQNNKAIVDKTDGRIQQIVFSGNGSKLFKLLCKEGDSQNMRLIELINRIINHVYDHKEREDIIKVSFVDANWNDDKPPKIETTVGIKAATSVGSICWQLSNAADEKDNSKVIPIGDKNTILATNSAGLLDGKTKANWVSTGTGSENQINIIQKVKENFEAFLDGFLGKEGENSLFDYDLSSFGIRNDYRKEISKIIKDNDLINKSIKDHQVKYPAPTHSIFFVPVKRLIIELSKYFTNI